MIRITERPRTLLERAATSPAIRNSKLHCEKHGMEEANHCREAGGGVKSYIE